MPMFALAADSKPELLVVYWSSKDCRWCTYWESSMSGMEKKFKESDEFKKIKYRVVKNERLKDSYTRQDFPPDISWIFDRIATGEEKQGFRPGWIVYVDQKQLARFAGTRDWNSHHFPEIKKLVAEHLGK
jgi:hypothetical protein